MAKPLKPIAWRRRAARQHARADSFGAWLTKKLFVVGDELPPRDVLCAQAQALRAAIRGDAR